MPKFYPFLVSLLAFHVVPLAFAEKPLPPASTQSVEYARHVEPLLAKHCLRCHGPEKQRGRFRVDLRSALLRGGGSGEPAILVGDSAKSYLIRVVSGHDADLVMPPKGRTLTDAEIGVLRAWIDAGAKWPGQEEVVEGPGLDHWSFRPIRRPAVPVTRGVWSNSPIDAFVLARLEKAGLSPSPRADRRTLFRRASLLLTGLPPTHEEIDERSADTKVDAYESMVEALLGSPAYGERWARHWLDIVRFAETNGFETNTPRPTAWHYRDYVIDAFNADKPYHVFVREQLAGDRLGADRATGFLVGGPFDTVKSPDINLTQMQRQDELHDIINTTSTAFLGVTVACARCHNHKFDPISQRDYYAFQAVFAGVKHGERAIATDTDFDRNRRRESSTRRLRKLRAELVEVEKRIPSSRLRPPVHAKHNEESFPATPVDYVRFRVLATNTKSEPCLDELEVYDTQGKNVALATTGATATSTGDYAGNPKHKLEHINDGQLGNPRSWISNQRGKGEVQIGLARTTTIERVVWGRDRTEKYADRLPIAYEIEVANKVGGKLQWRSVASSRSRLPFGTSSEKALLDRLKGLPPEKANRVRELIEAVDGLQKQVASLSRPAKGYVGTFVQPGTTHRLYRGDPMAKREVVAPGAITALGRPLGLKAHTVESARRLALAQWMTDVRNPLTARVIVNRLWQHHFGSGLVTTPSDFGKMGTKPTHPELLDWLAKELIDSGWSLKHIQKLIVTSATWQQASRPRADAVAIDAGSRLLWRFPPRRVEAEVLRDTILSLSGSLDRRMRGPGFDLFEPNANYVRVYRPRTTFGPEHWRRMIYMYKVRMELDATFGAFDCPDAGQATAKRPRSTTALQALNLLNSPFVLQQADLMAQRVQREVGVDVEAGVRRSFQLALGRSPSADEHEVSTKFVREHGLSALCRVLFNANELLFVS